MFFLETLLNYAIQSDDHLPSKAAKKASLTLSRAKSHLVTWTFKSLSSLTTILPIYALLLIPPGDTVGLCFGVCSGSSLLVAAGWW